MIKRLLYQIRDYFGVTRREARGFVAVVVLIVVLWFGPLAYERFFPALPQPITTTDNRTADSLLAILEAQQPLRPDYAKNNKQRFEESPERPLSLFYFDPNTASGEQLQELGIPRFLAERIVKYRAKGGKFRKKEDLQKIYDFRPDLYERLAPYISIADVAPTSFETKTSEKPAFADTKPAYVKPALQPFDINTADTSQLIQLKGIGSKLAARIVKFRDGLGGFASANQYAEVFGLDSLALSELNKYAPVRTAQRKIRINLASVEELDRHPYISPLQAKLMVRYREQHGAYPNAQELLKIKILDQKFVDKITPYLEF
ncbi:MAG: helix-hairpin-helix domain-containing protein [Runella slithyformis]|nr:MAG: helix-hairpin-helix domain-containing protein [Runella slithyformis]TAF97896.1 MAG: helix-hairpin-helix domain-containing protein [Runella sp.]TAG24306.1 MAG: helix-hairpin-helix domain-containing protein [Cytophagales bacterium]TAG38971.1 MAG: helix-hairpin-helix domain-containing protein [Cytophagia bacterium]TAE96597.1 MAG: helix-hairpin-helix domain-containing protein [Runella slithyformis]